MNKNKLAIFEGTKSAGNGIKNPKRNKLSEKIGRLKLKAIDGKIYANMVIYL